MIFDRLLKWYQYFSSQPLLNQILLFTTSWLLLTFFIDCWFSPFLLQGYQLATILAAFSFIGWYAAKRSITLVFQREEPFTFPLVKRKPLDKLRQPKKLLRFFEHEIRSWAEDLTNEGVKSWYGSISDSLEFPQEVQSQLEDILVCVSKRIVNLSSQEIAQNAAKILQQHLANYNNAKRHLPEGGNVERNFRFRHPVTKGEISLNDYLNQSSAQFLKLIIPGSVQDCKAAFHFLCLIFARQVLWNVVQASVQPETVLLAVLDLLTPEKTNSVLNNTEQTEKLIINNKETPESETVPITQTNHLPDKKLPSLDLDLKPVSSNVENPVKDLSPVYEEVEDFASAIARLRSLLEQRDSQQSISSTGSDSSAQKMTQKAHGRLLSETDSSFEDLTEAPEGSSEGRVFTNISIPEAELCSQTGDFIYCIVYDAVYAAAGSEFSASLPESLENGEVSMAVEARETRYVIKKRSVKRRFNEFIQFHSQLVTSLIPAARCEARNVRGPAKWLNLPLSRADQSTINHGKRYLERYLQQLCSSSAFCASPELRGFLDYECCGTVESGNVTTSIAAQRLDRFLVKTVSGVLQSIRTALPIPGAESDTATVTAQLVPLPPPPIQTLSAVDTTDGKNSRDVISGLSGLAENGLSCSVSISAESSGTAYLLDSYISLLDLRVDSAYEALEHQAAKTESPGISPTFLAADRELEPPHLGKRNKFDSVLPLSSAAIDLLAEILPDHEALLNKAAVIYMLKTLLGTPLENYLENVLDEMTSPAVILKQLQEFRTSLWMESSCAELDTVSPDAEQVDRLKNEITAHLKEILPGGVRFLLGEETYSLMIDNVLSCFSHRNLNQDLVLTFLDFILSLICVSR